jgi:hypothetical protein
MGNHEKLVITTAQRSRSVARGVLAACSLPPDEAFVEISLVVEQGLVACRAALETLPVLAPTELRVLLLAEQSFMEAILEMVDSRQDVTDSLALIGLLVGSLRSA